MNEYLKTVLEQIRCKKVHPYIEEELRAHMEDQIEECMTAGLSYEEAEQWAIEDMGSAVETGVALDQIHRPQIAWNLVGFIAILSVMGIVIHWMITKSISTGLENELAAVNTRGSSLYGLHVVLGLICMIIVYLIDYTRIVRYARLIGAGFLLVIIMGFFGYSPMVNGMHLFFQINGFNVSYFSLSMLYVPVYSAICYHYYGKSYSGLARCIFWLVAPTTLLYLLRSFSFVTLAMLVGCMLVILSIAIWNNWFQLAKKRSLAFLWLGFAGCPFISLGLFYGFHLLKEYQMDRIRFILSGSSAWNAYLQQIRRFVISSHWVGQGDQMMDHNFAGFNNSFILTYLSTRYGILAGVLATCLVATLILLVFHSSFAQKNQAGMLMGCGCGMVLLSNTFISIFMNMGIIPATSTFFPFLSVGGSNLILCYILMGIVLSIYRYKNVYPKHIRMRKNMA